MNVMEQLWNIVEYLRNILEYHGILKEYHGTSIDIIEYLRNLIEYLWNIIEYSATLCALGPGPEMGRRRELRQTHPGSRRRLRGEYAESRPMCFGIWGQ